MVDSLIVLRHLMLNFFQRTLKVRLEGSASMKLKDPGDGIYLNLSELLYRFGFVA